MSKFLDDFLLTMPETQKQKVMELLIKKEKDGLLRSEEEFKKELQLLLDDMSQKNGEPTFLPIRQEQRTHSENYNKNMQEISFDLETIFSASNQIERLVGDNQQLSRALLADIRKKLYGLRTNVQKYKIMIKNSDSFIDGVYEDFKSPQYTEANESQLSVLRRERYGDIRTSNYNAENIGDALQLSGIQSLDQLKTSYGRSLADISVINRTGLEASNQKHKLANAIDGSIETFWAESILVDDVITQDISDLWSHDYHDYPKSGAICEMEIKLNGLSTVSEIHFDPYCAYPLEIVAITGYETMDSGGKVYDLTSPLHENLHQRSKKSTDRMVFQFPSVEISKIRILLRQENYVKENFIVNVDEKNNTELWDNISSSEQLTADFSKPGETLAEFDQKNEVTGWSVYLKKLKEWATITRNTGVLESVKNAMEIIKLGDYKNPMLLALRSLSKGTKTIVENKNSPDVSKEWLAVNKLSYLYGAYNISVFGRKYQNTSFYVSKPLPLSSNAAQIVLSTEEKHHDIEVGINTTARITDIEHYITHKKNPLPKDWRPILPIEKRYVEGELLSGDDIEQEYPELKDRDTINFSFRFPIISKETIVIRRNGYPLPLEAYILTADGKRVGILREHYSASSIYTADYKPADSAYMVVMNGENGVEPTQFINKNGDTGERFNTADSDNSITLTHMPYLHRDKLFGYDEDLGRYQEEKETLEASNIFYPIIVRVDGEEYKNITDYATNSYDPDRLKENAGKTYAQIGDRILFGQPDGNKVIANVTVDYYFITTNIRLKSILRRNHAGNESITPALYHYQVKCQSYDLEV